MIYRLIRERLRRSPSVMVAAALLVSGAAGCSYTSEYVAPRDGRVRAVWRDSDVVLESAGAPLEGDCYAQMVWLKAGGQGVFDPGAGRRYRYDGPRGPWTPVYYGPQIYVSAPGLAPTPPMPPMFRSSPSLSLFHAAHAAGAQGPSLGGVHGGGSGSNDALLYLLILALLVLPIIDLTFALGPAESPGTSSRAIDEVNTYNDLLRTPGSACASAEGPQ